MRYWTKIIALVAICLIIAALVILFLPHMASAAPEVSLTAPRIEAPDNGVEIAYAEQPFVFNWDAVPQADGYFLQVATSPDFKDPVVNHPVHSDGWAAQNPFLPQSYFWRVRAMRDSSKGPWSETRHVVIVRGHGAGAQPTPMVLPTLVGPIVTHEPSALSRRVPYSVDSPWNTPIPANASIDGRSKEMIALLGHSTTNGKIGSNTRKFTFPVYWADASTPRYDLACEKYRCTVVANGELLRVDAIYDVPIPDGARPSSGDDAQMIIVDTETGTEYGLYEAHQESNGRWRASNAYQYNIYMSGSTPGFVSRGAGMPYLAGLIRPWEIEQGRIDHAIAFAYESTAATKCVYPASRTDGTSDEKFAMPMGARIQLNPALTEADFNNMGLSRAGKIVARALQVYGMYLVDTGGSPKIMAENLEDNVLQPQKWGDPILQYSEDLIEAIPFNEFRVLALPSGYWSGGSTSWGKCYK